MTTKCVACGKFIPYADMERALASFHHEPASLRGHEVNEWTCAACVIEDLRAEVARLRHALRLARLYVAGAKCKSLRYENIVADDTRIVDEALARAAHKE